MDIISYILELIETRKTVGIKALGTLYKKKTPGRYDSETHSFLPPKHEIAFTTTVKEQEELVNFISEKRNISIESATLSISEFVENIQAQLADHQQANFSPLGELKIINGQIIFEASKDNQVGFDFYGLPSVVDHKEQPNNEIEVMAPLEKEPPLQPREVEKEIEPISQAELTPQETKTESFIDPSWRPPAINRDEYDYNDDDDERTSGRGMRIFLKTLLVLLIILIAGAAIYFIYPDLFNRFKQNSQDIETGTGPAVMTDGKINQKTDTAFSDFKKKTTISANLEDSLKIDSLKRKTTYEVIGSAMKTQKKVDQVITNLSKRGINAKKMEAMPGRLIKISLGTFTDYNLAKKFQDSLKIKLRNPDIYIQTIKPKN